MAVKIRLQRHGKKGHPIYWMVIADERSKRDGKYINLIIDLHIKQYTLSVLLYTFFIDLITLSFFFWVSG